MPIRTKQSQSTGRGKRRRKKLTPEDTELGFQQYLLFALGPLELSHEDLWRVTIGELNDLIIARRYKDYLEMQKQAQFAQWLMSCWVKKAPSVQDMVGVWDEKLMRPLGNREAYEIAKERIRSKKRNRIK